MERPLPRLHLVTDDAILAHPAFPARAAAALSAGGAGVALHLRGPGTPGGPLLERARALLAAADEAGALLVVNDRVDVAALAGAHGVHLGARSLPVDVARSLLPPEAGVGLSVHGAEEARAAAADGPDWAFVGTIWPTRSHPGREGAGPEGVERAVAACGGLPLLAIGGVTPERVASARKAGAWGVAVLRGVWEAPDPGAAVEAYLEALEGAEA